MARDPKVEPMVAQVGSGLWLLARVAGVDGNNAIPAEVNKIHVKVDRANGGDLNPLIDEDLTPVATYLSATLLGTSAAPDPRWERECDDEEDGFNFEYWLPHTIVTVQDHYRVEFTFVDTSSRQWKVIFEGPARSGDNTDYSA